MLTKRDGHIVTIASVAGFTVAPQLTDYCASKYGAIGFNECLDAELNYGTYDSLTGPSGQATSERDRERSHVDTTVVCPYFVHTTGLFRGCRSTEPFLFPEITAQLVASETVRGVITRRKTVYVPPIFYAIATVKTLLPSSAINLLMRFSKADSFMDTFVGSPSKAE